MNIRDTVFKTRIDELTYERDCHLAEAYVCDLQIKAGWWAWVAAESLEMINEGCPNYSVQGDQ